MAFIAPSKDLEPQESISQGFVAPSKDLEPSGFIAPAKDLDSDDPGAADYVAAFGSDIAISEAGRLGGAAVGTAILPGVGTAIGYVLGGMGAGAAGSIARQRILDPDGEISEGQDCC
jgi:hypothetical protein